jgi:DNA-binding NarL/FixJ family response regulator
MRRIHYLPADFCMTITSVLLADDIETFRSSVRALLQAQKHIAVVAEAPNGREALRLAARHKPDVALIDLKMPLLDGVEVTRQLRIEVPDCRVIILTTFDDDDRLFAALRAGACGYLLKDQSASRLVDAIAAAQRGESVLSPRVVGKVVAEFARLPARNQPTEHGLSPRELDVLTLLARGAVNKEIATTLGISEGTVKNHLTALFTKLGVSHRTQAAIKARELGLL